MFINRFSNVLKSSRSPFLILLLPFILLSCGYMPWSGPSDSIKNQESAEVPTDGNYFLSSVIVEASDIDGRSIESSPIQVLGENYFWNFRSLGNKEYEIVARGSAKFSSNDVVFLEWNCVGNRDVFVFEMLDGSSITNFKTVESGCPQGFRANDATQLSIETLSETSFVLRFVSQGNGVRSIESFTFRKR